MASAGSTTTHYGGTAASQLTLDPAATSSSKTSPKIPTSNGHRGGTVGAGDLETNGCHWLPGRAKVEAER